MLRTVAARRSVSRSTFEATRYNSSPAGVLLGTRFLATPEAPVPDGFKRTLVESDGHDTLLTEIPDIAAGRVWPGAMSRVQRNRFVERWAGREWELRRLRDQVGPELAAARRRAAGD